MNMDMPMSSTMDMSQSTATGAAAAATSTAAAMSMSMGGSCKISMLWNWYTVDSCFISRSWHITSKGMFAGSCIGVVLLVILLEFLRRASKEYDRFILQQYKNAHVRSTNTDELASDDSSQPKNSSSVAIQGPAATSKPLSFRPSVVQQAIRALLHMCQFAIAYFVMLLAMYYNGYFIICIFLGAYIGAFIFSWEAFSVVEKKEEVSMCCG